MTALARQPARLSDLVPICDRLPAATIDQLIGATRVISRAGGRMRHNKLAAALRFNDEHTAGAVGFLARLGLVEQIGGDIALTGDGKRIATAGIPARRRIFAELAIRLPIIREITTLLAGEPGGSLARGELLERLGAQSCAADADRVFDHVIAWGRYANLFAYDAAAEQVTLSKKKAEAPR
jgi:NitT/TauT family transport system ATP-binding protein